MKKLIEDKNMKLKILNRKDDIVDIDLYEYIRNELIYEFNLGMN